MIFHFRNLTISSLGLSFLALSHFGPVYADDFDSSPAASRTTKAAPSVKVLKAERWGPCGAYVVRNSFGADLFCYVPGLPRVATLGSTLAGAFDSCCPFKQSEDTVATTIHYAQPGSDKNSQHSKPRFELRNIDLSKVLSKDAASNLGVGSLTITIGK